MNYEREVDPFIVQSRFVSPLEPSEMPCLVDQRCLVVNKPFNYESLGVVHRRNEILINKIGGQNGQGLRYYTPSLRTERLRQPL